MSYTKYVSFITPYYILNRTIQTVCNPSCQQRRVTSKCIHIDLKILFNNNGSSVADMSKAPMFVSTSQSSSQEYLPLIAKDVGFSPAQSYNFMWESF